MPDKPEIRKAAQDRIAKLIRAIPFNADKSAKPQIRDGIKALIHSGSLKPGDQLPSLSKMATVFDVTTATVGDALQALKKGDNPTGFQAGTVVTKDGYLASIAFTKKANPKQIAAIKKSDSLLQTLQIQKRPDVSLDGQLVKGIQKLIREGHLKPGDPLPSTRRMADLYDIAKGTCTKAVQLLRRDGVLTGRSITGLIVAIKPVKQSVPDRPESGQHSPHMEQYIERLIRTIPIDKNAPAPLYRQFRDGLAKMIEDGHLAMGDWLPTINRMAILANVGTSCVVDAIHDLRRSRLLCTLYGIGNVVGSPESLRPADPAHKTPADIESLFRSVRIDRKLPTPAGQQLQAGIMQLIREGQLKPGDRLPPVKRLFAVTTVSTTTITKVTRALVKLGILTGKGGSGTMITDKASSAVAPVATKAHAGKQSADLAALAGKWASLPPHIREAILLIAEVRRPATHLCGAAQET